MPGFRIASLTFLILAPSALSQVEEEIKISGLQESVEIITDSWGIPHIYASNQADLFFAQGFNAAKDRLFQFELWRRRALGLLAEIQGQKALQHDIGARLLRFRGDIQKEMRHYHSDGEEIIESFVNGVNSYIELARSDPEKLPLEFGLLGIKPGYWTPEIVISRQNAISVGAAQEVMISKLVDAVGQERARDVLDFHGSPSLIPKEGINLSQITDDILTLYKASRTMPAFDQSDIEGHDNSTANSGLAKVNLHLDSNGDLLRYIEALGSNNWVISGNRTASGHSVLANDPHRSIEVPSLRYWAHLVAPGWNVIGGGEPVLPGISIGHNEYGAWGLTIFVIDQEDIYVYNTNPQNPNQYRYNDRWVDMDLVVESIPVRGSGNQNVELKFTRHGPVLFQDRSNHKAYAMRAAWLDIGGAPYLASLRMDQATNWKEFREACTWSGMPGENMLWADRQGNIGWQSVGSTPLRIGWDGALPVPGDGRYEWTGFAPIQSMPNLLNPKEGHWQTANRYNVPDGYPNIFSFLSTAPWRLERIHEMLNSGASMTLEDSIELQHDLVSLPARILVPLFQNIESERDDILKAKNLLLNWKFRMENDSISATIYREWERELEIRLIARLMPEGKEDLLDLSTAKIVNWLQDPADAPDGVFPGEATLARNELIIDAMSAAFKNLRAHFGTDISHWKYGRLEGWKLAHPLSHLVSEETQEVLSFRTTSRSGNTDTVHLHHNVGDKHIGASFKFIVDTSDWDLAKGSNTPGQSGNPRSQHYRDLLEMWSNGNYFPVYFSKEKIKRSASKVTILRPH